MRKTFHLLRRGLKDKGKNVEENSTNKTEKAIHRKGRDSVE